MSETEAPKAGVFPYGIIPENGNDPCIDDNRRREPRYPAEHGQANLGWYHGESYRTVAGRLEDVSSGGASLVVDDGATWEGGDVWLCLSGGVRTEWVRAEVAGATQVEGSAQRIRLKFHESCPFDFFKTAAWGTPDTTIPRGESPTSARTDAKGAGQGPHVACTTPAETHEVDLRVSVAMFQSPRPPDEPGVGRARDDERDDRLVLISRAYITALQLVGALLVAGVIVIKLVAIWRLDTLLGFGEPGP
ncbi:MAG: PilZ domain-containing protein [Isosphaeraceae bacterium]|nr:PilZ domain-containing protein [Isosphaeraceae bacterium]